MIYRISAYGLIPCDVEGTKHEYVQRTLTEYIGTRVNIVVTKDKVEFVFTADVYPTKEVAQASAFLRGWMMRTTFGSGS